MLYILRDLLGTYKVGLATDVRRPRLATQRFDQSWLVVLARSLCRDDSNKRIISSLVERSTGRVATGGPLHERFAELVVSGRLVLREAEVPDAYPLPDPYADVAVPLVELAVDEPVDDDPRSTWISLEVVHAADVSTERVELEITTANGRELHGRLDAKGRWRCDDVDAGRCTVNLLEHPALQRYHPTGRSRLHPSQSDIAWLAGSNLRLNLRSAAHHRIVIVQPPQGYCPST